MLPVNVLTLIWLLLEIAWQKKLSNNYILRNYVNQKVEK